MGQMYFILLYMRPTDADMLHAHMSSILPFIHWELLKQ